LEHRYCHTDNSRTFATVDRAAEALGRAHHKRAATSSRFWRAFGRLSLPKVPEAFHRGLRTAALSGSQDDTAAVSSSCSRTTPAAAYRIWRERPDLLLQSGPRAARTFQRDQSRFGRMCPLTTWTMDLAKIETLGIPVTDARTTLCKPSLAALYINDFNAFGRTWQVVAGRAGIPQPPADHQTVFLCAHYGGDMVPLRHAVHVRATSGPDVVYRYNRNRAIQILGGPAPGFSSGDGQRRHGTSGRLGVACPATACEWTGTTYQQKEAQGHEGVIFGFAGVLVFLFFGAALYESWFDSVRRAAGSATGPFSARCGPHGCARTRTTSTRTHWNRYL